MTLETGEKTSQSGHFLISIHPACFSTKATYRPASFGCPRCDVHLNTNQSPRPQKAKLQTVPGPPSFNIVGWRAFGGLKANRLMIEGRPQGQKEDLGHVKSAIPAQPVNQPSHQPPKTIRGADGSLLNWQKRRATRKREGAECGCVSMCLCVSPPLGFLFSPMSACPVANRVILGSRLQ